MFAFLIFVIGLFYLGLDTASIEEYLAAIEAVRAIAMNIGIIQFMA